MKIVSDAYTVQYRVPEVIAFLSKPENIEALLPKDRFSEFKSTENSCSFKIQGGIDIPLKLDSCTENVVTYVGDTSAPFAFTLRIELLESKEETLGKVVFDASPNGFLEMLIKRPLTQLFNDMSQNLDSAIRASK